MATASTDAALTITTDPSRLDLDVVHGFLAASYWAAGIPRQIVERSVRHSLCFGAFDGDRQVGFARVISDYATYAYICDVFVIPSHRGRGVGKQLMTAIVAHPDLQDLRRWALFTRDAHGLYRQFGFGEPRYPERLMEVLSPPYGAATGGEGAQGHPGRAAAASLPTDPAGGRRCDGASPRGAGTDAARIAPGAGGGVFPTGDEATARRAGIGTGLLRGGRRRA